MQTMNYQFNAQAYKPEMGGNFVVVPDGVYDYLITAVEIKPTKDNAGGYFSVTHTLQGGQHHGGEIINMFNLWHPKPDVQERAHKNLSALCHAIGVFAIDFNNGGQAIVGGRGKFELKTQPGRKETSPNGQVTEYGPRNNVVDYLTPAGQSVTKGTQVQGGAGGPPQGQMQPQVQPTQQPQPGGPAFAQQQVPAGTPVQMQPQQVQQSPQQGGAGGPPGWANRG